MTTGAVIAIAIGAVLLVAVLVLASIAARQRRLNARRDEAAELREEAQAHELRANRERRFAQAKHEEAASVDPDADGDEDEADGDDAAATGRTTRRREVSRNA